MQISYEMVSNAMVFQLTGPYNEKKLNTLLTDSSFDTFKKDHF